MIMTDLRRYPPFTATVLSTCVVLAAWFVSRPVLSAEHDLTVGGAWIRFIMPSIPAAAYFRLSNQGDKPRVLIGADSPACGSLMLHESVVANGTDRMMMVESVRVPAHGHVDFIPGHYHLMCMEPSKEMILGHQVPVTLRLADGAKITASFTVRGATG
jgi:periplasmic copper chaperone A